MNFSKRKTVIYIAAIVALFVIAAGLASLSALFAANGSVAHAATDFKSIGKAAYLIDADSGAVLYARNENERMPIASMVKIMTALIAFEAIDRGDASLDDDVKVSAVAAGMGGSQVFLDADTTHKLGDLLKTIIVASANDSCVAVAEHLESSVGAFVAKMNARAKELGMQNTSFKNCTGLPAAESYSSAKDAAIMFKELIKHQKYFEYASIWLEDYVHPDGRATTITNTNKLVRFYNGCDGGKTGFTNEARFCLTATAKRDGMRVIAAITGAPSAKERNAAVSAMFDYAFDNYKNETVLKAGEEIKRIEVLGGKQSNVGVTVERDLMHFMSRAENGEYELKYDLKDRVSAPIAAGDRLGVAYLVKGGEVVAEVPVVSMESVKRMSIFDAIAEIGRHWATRTNR